MGNLPTQNIFKRTYRQSTLFDYRLACLSKVENVLKGSLDLIPSPSPMYSKNSNYGWKFCLRCIVKTLLGDVNKLFVFKVC